MILYHGSNITIETIDFNKCKPGKDFGKGFYLTDIKQQAEEMARRSVRIAQKGEPVVTTYDFNHVYLIVLYLSRYLKSLQRNGLYSFLKTERIRA